MHSPLHETNILKKMELARKLADEVMQRPRGFEVPAMVGRDIMILPPEKFPPKKGLSSAEGQGRLLHDLASIELQAMELGFRGLVDYPDAPPSFREELLALMLSEVDHLELCLQALEKIGFKWGDFPAHVGLLDAISAEDSLLDRILIVHCYLEGSGLDSGDRLLRRLHSIAGNPILPALKVIVREEIGHVELGVRWFRQLCREEGRDPQVEFPVRMEALRSRIPKRVDPISPELRAAAGFSEAEIAFLDQYRASMTHSPRQNPTPDYQGKPYLKEILRRA